MRERLGDLYDPAGQQTHIFTAQFHCFGRTDEGSNVALLVAVYLGCEKWLSDHVWIHRSKQLKLLMPDKGDILEFEAVVGRYPRSESFSRAEDCQWDFSLEHIRDIRILRKRVNGSASE